MKGIEVMLTGLMFVFTVIVILVLGLLLLMVGYDVEGRVSEIYRQLSTKDVTENVFEYVKEVDVTTSEGSTTMPLANYLSYLLSMPRYIEDEKGEVMETPEGDMDTGKVYEEVKKAVDALRNGYDFDAICLILEKGDQSWIYYPEPLDQCDGDNICCKWEQNDVYYYDCMDENSCIDKGSGAEAVEEGFCCPGKEVCCVDGNECTDMETDMCPGNKVSADETKCTGSGIAKCKHLRENEIYISTFDGPGTLIVGVNE